MTRPARIAAITTLLAATLTVAATASSGAPESVLWDGPEVVLSEAQQEAADAAVRPDGSVVLPTTYCRGYFIAEVMLNGTGPYPMIVDSGASTTVLTPATKRAAGVRGSIDEFAIGKLTGRRIRNTEIELEHLGWALGTEVAGIVGHPVFRTLLVTYDYPNKELRVRDGNLPREGEGILRTSDGRRPFIEARIGDREFNILVDTGAGGGLTLVDLEDYELDDGPTTVGLHGRVDGFYVKRGGVLANDFLSGPLRVVAPVAEESVSVNLLGQDVLTHFAVTFDTDDGRMLLERSDAPVDTPIEIPPIRNLGATLLPRDGYYEVERIFADSGNVLREGDHVVAVDGEPVPQISCRESLTGDRPAGTPLPLTVERDGETIEVRVPVFEYGRR